mmetsp:Transcript_16908/g.33031  ORF Transcript_16908/g.33031 Transcript_16908/m.33031 type:complete len:228 (-) Transcript_16908:301-984(-)|eukprot:CAMPEP_0175155576 /NCGR_PEP_ID=MMETSP0087-20121206/21064_1 /TAXON_ID=136419 /ORGANISM="Unknown Unknown, Strain D1" /LENGTH=227 /DNA_ID=CAMNT_0016442771 /DNA_START=100 /DNA_END=783 /DNA_ORIENTATION=+
MGCGASSDGASANPYPHSPTTDMTPPNKFEEEKAAAAQPKVKQVKRLSDEEVKRIYGTENDCDTYKVRIEQPTAFPGVAACGQFDWDRGYQVDGVVINGEYHKDHFLASKHVLPEHPKFADVTTRPLLCFNWVRRVLLAFHMVIDESAAEIGRSMPRFGSSYHRPQYCLSNGLVECTLWVRMKEEGDSDPDNTYRRLQFLVGPDGVSYKPSVLSRMVVPIKNRDLVN